MYPSAIRSRSSRKSQFLTRLRIKERSTCCADNPLRPVGIFQTLLQITPYGLDQLFVVVKKIGDALQQRLQQNALLQQLPIVETDLRLRSSPPFSTSCPAPVSRL